MEDRLPAFDQQIKLHVTGCTNSCGQSWIADIGLEGKKIKKDGKMVDAFYFCVGGAVGKYAAIARQIGYRAAAEDCPDAIERLLRAYLEARQPAKTCAPTSPAPTTRAFAPCSRAPPSPPSNATLHPLAGRHVADA